MYEGRVQGYTLIDCNHSKSKVEQDHQATLHRGLQGHLCLISSPSIYAPCVHKFMRLMDGDCSSMHRL